MSCALLCAACMTPHRAAAGALEDGARAVLAHACAFDPSVHAAPPQGFASSRPEVLTAPGRPARTRFVLTGPNGQVAEVLIDAANRANRRLTVTLKRGAAPMLQILADQSAAPGASAAGTGARTCRVREARRIVRDRNGKPERIALLDAGLNETGRAIELDPPVPPGKDAEGVTLAHIDSGVNYLLPQIAGALARDDAGRILGHDFWDGDARPYDVDTGRSAFFPLHHGTTVASLLLREAPRVRLVPLRYPRPHMARMGDAVRHAVAAGARIIALPMGSRDRRDWDSFEAAARASPDVLFVVSAGNAGRDIDAAPLFPASLDLANMLVVTSSDDFGRLAPAPTGAHAAST